MAVKSAVQARPWLIAYGISIAVIALNVALRDFVWRYSWPNVTMNLAFFSIMLGPLFGGICGWWASRIAHKNDALTRLSSRRVSVVFQEVGILWTAVFFSYVVVGVVLALVTLASGGIIEHWQTFLPPVSALILHFGMGVMGFVIGSHWHSAWMPLFVSVGLFFAAMVLYGTHLSPLVQVGGASAVLFTLLPNWIYHLIGAIGWAAISVGVAMFFMASTDRQSLQRCAIGVVTIAAACGFVWVLDSDLTEESVLNQGGEYRFVEVEPNITCEPLPQGGELCIAQGFESFRNEAELAIADVRRKYAKIGLDLDATWSQVSEVSQIEVSPEIEDYDSDLWNPVLTYFAVASCGPEVFDAINPEFDAQWNAIADFMLDETNNAQLHREAANAIERIRQCSF